MVMYLVRGVPGSGKSTVAKKLLDNKLVDAWYEADMYMTNENGYEFKRENLSKAHEYSQKYAEAVLVNQKKVVISNTFTKLWELIPYFEIAEKYKSGVIVIECDGEYDNVHGVPREVVERMKKKWEELPNNFKPVTLPEDTTEYLERTLGISVAKMKIKT